MCPSDAPRAEGANAALLEALRDVVDPELGIDVVALGLVYEAVIESGRARVALAMTTPMCPMADLIVRDAEASIRRRLPDLTAIDVRLVDDPPWTPSRISDDARRLLGWSAD